MTSKAPLRHLKLMFVPGLFLLLVPGLLRSYLLMPFLGSQDLEAIGLAYLLEHTLLFTRIAGAILVVPAVIDTFLHRSGKARIVIGIAGAVSFVLVYCTDFYFSAERMFREPTITSFAAVRENKVDPGKLVIGIEQNGIAKAYPINYLGYHHKVQDSVAGTPILVTYCTMCRTGRVFSPIVKGQHQEFRLVGARHYNAVIEDQATRTWWYQESGEAAAGPLRGSLLNDFPYEQMTLRSWIERHPNTLVLQPDSNFTEEYTGLEGYDRSVRVQKDSSGNLPSWQQRSWVIGVAASGVARAYEWNDVLKLRAINDRLGELPLLIALEDDALSYHVWNRTVNGRTLDFVLDRTNSGLVDTSTNSGWNWEGECTRGPLKGARLEKIPAHQEYWHAWQNFHRSTSRWKG